MKNIMGQDKDNYCHRKNKLDLGKFNLIYCQLNRVEFLIFSLGNFTTPLLQRLSFTLSFPTSLSEQGREKRNGSHGQPLTVPVYNFLLTTFSLSSTLGCPHNCSPFRKYSQAVVWSPPWPPVWAYCSRMVFSTDCGGNTCSSIRNISSHSFLILWPLGYQGFFSLHFFFSHSSLFSVF